MREKPNAPNGLGWCAPGADQARRSVTVEAGNRSNTHSRAYQFEQQDFVVHLHVLLNVWKLAALLTLPKRLFAPPVHPETPRTFVAWWMPRKVIGGAIDALMIGRHPPANKLVTRIVGRTNGYIGFAPREVGEAIGRFYMK
ncbi:MAG: hypothetical protein ABI414_03575 [Devosia sp.]